MLNVTVLQLHPVTVTEEMQQPTGTFEPVALAEIVTVSSSLTSGDTPAMGNATASALTPTSTAAIVVGAMLGILLVGLPILCYLDVRRRWGWRVDLRPTGGHQKKENSGIDSFDAADVLVDVTSPSRSVLAKPGASPAAGHVFVRPGSTPS